MPYMKMRDGASLHYLDVGRGQACVLVHGFAMFSAMWLPFVAPLADRYRFILPDLRGWGKSHDLPLLRDNVIAQHADDLADLMAGLGLDHVRLAGLSMGACTAMQYLQDYGTGRVDAYLNIDQTPCIVNHSDWPYGLMGAAQPHFFAAWGQLIRDLELWRDHRFQAVPRRLRRRMFRQLGEFVGHAFYRRHWRTLRFAAGNQLLMRRVMAVSNWPVYLRTMGSYADGAHDWRAALTRVDIPVTVLIGAESKLYPAEGQARIADYAPHTRVVKVPRVGHVVPFEAPRRFVLELRRFLCSETAVTVATTTGWPDAA